MPVSSPDNCPGPSPWGPPGLIVLQPSAGTHAGRWQSGSRDNRRDYRCDYPRGYRAAPELATLNCRLINIQDAASLASPDAGFCLWDSIARSRSMRISAEGLAVDCGHAANGPCQTAGGPRREPECRCLLLVVCWKF